MRTNVTNTSNSESVVSKLKPKLVSAAAGFPKDWKSAKVRKGQIGDDAYIITTVESADILGLLSEFLFFKNKSYINDFMKQVLQMVLEDGEIME